MLYLYIEYYLNFMLITANVVLIQPKNTINANYPRLYVIQNTGTPERKKGKGGRKFQKGTL